MKTIKYIIAFSLTLMMGACAEFLDEKPDIALVVPSTLDDLQGLLDDTVLRLMNIGSGGMILSADEIKITDNGFAARSLLERQLYVWDSELLLGIQNFGDWSLPYQQVFNANLVLDRLENIDPKSAEEQTKKQHVKGRALFYRAMAFHNLMEVFCLPYNPSTAPQNLGIPLRISSNINLNVGRSSLEETYQFIVRDLLESAELLPEQIDFITRPSKAAAYALLARLSLIGNNYENAVVYGTNAVAYSKELLNYNNVIPAPLIQFPFAANPELIFHQSTSGFGSIALSPQTLVNNEILEMYEEGDLRRSLYFLQRPSGFSFKGNYSGQVFWFTGLALDEVYLNLSESLARLGRLEESQAFLNELMEKRFDPEFFQPVETNDSEELLNKVLEERRKSLLFRSTRWMDLRRLNQEPARAITLSREVGGQVYTLTPNSVNYALPIPESDIELGGLVQNPRE